MSGTDHRRDPFLALARSAAALAKGPSRRRLRKAQRRGDRFRLGMRVRGRAIRIFNPGGRNFSARRRLP